MTNTHTGDPIGRHYELVIEGTVSDRFLSPFDDFTIERHSGCTTLTGVIRDSSHLHGVISQLLAVGLEIVSVRAIDNNPPTKRPVPDLTERRDRQGSS